jgi:hypothetical protein
VYICGIREFIVKSSKTFAYFVERHGGGVDITGGSSGGWRIIFADNDLWCLTPRRRRDLPGLSRGVDDELNSNIGKPRVFFIVDYNVALDRETLS